MQGHDYGWMGYKGPSNIPAWNVDVFVPDESDFYVDRQPNLYAVYGDKVFWRRGQVSYAMYDEIQSNAKEEKYKTYTKGKTFTKLPVQNIKLIDIPDDE